MGQKQSKENREQQWDSWKQKYGKRYSEAEDAEKKRAWKATLAKVTAHNQKYDQGLVSYRLGMNKFAVEDPPLQTRCDNVQTEEQLGPSIFRGRIRTIEALPRRSFDFNDEVPMFVELGEPWQTEHDSLEVVQSAVEPPPPGIDYRTKGMVTSVKNQDAHKTCYAFAAVGVLEAQHAKVNKQLVSLSAQQLVDCSDNIPGEGNVENCFEYAKRGLAREHNYPYNGKRESCQKYKTIEVKVKDYWSIHDETQLLAIVNDVGPVAVGINIPDDFKSLTNATDVYDNDCPNTNVWHCVLVVGYGTTPRRVRYWIIKNSWGEGWGNHGYIKMKRGVNLREIGNHARYATVQRN